MTSDKKSSSAVRSEEENYIKAMQGIYLRSLKYQHSLSEQNMMVHRLFKALKERREAAQALDHEIEKVKSLSSSKKSNKAAVVPAGVHHYLKVHLNHDDSDVVIYVGQVLTTPYGKGTVESFDVASLTVTIKLPFGQMYSHVSRVVCWCDWSSSSTDSVSASEAALIQSYDALHATSLLSIPWSEKLAMQDLVSSLPPSNADEDGGTVTDKEDGENESESDSPSDNDEEDDEEGGEAMDEEEDGSVQSRTNEIAEFLTHTGDATASNHNQQQQSNRNSSSSSSSSSASAVAAVFPIANTVPAAHSRREVKTKLAAERELHLRSVTTDKLKIALAPPGK